MNTIIPYELEVAVNVPHRQWLCHIVLSPLCGFLLSYAYSTRINSACFHAISIVALVYPAVTISLSFGIQHLCNHA